MRALRRFSAVRVVALGAVVLGLLGAPTPAQAQPGTILLDETFTGADAREFTGYNEACLTGASAGTPPAGDHALGGCEAVQVGPVPPLDGAPFGYLRLTDASNDKTAAVLYNHPLPANAGLDVTFDAWQYGSTTPANPADGISFFLVDGASTLTAPGAFGGSLGYAKKQPDADPGQPFIDGVADGYLGVGLDVLGNYFADTEQRGYSCEDQRSPAGQPGQPPQFAGRGPNMVTVRGPGNGIQGYCYITATTNFPHSVPPGGGPWPSNLPGSLQGSLTAFTPPVTPQSAQAQLEPSRRRVNVRLTPAPNPQLIVTIDFNDGTGPHQVLDVPAPAPVPRTYKFGFAASTGTFTDVHLIRNVIVETGNALPELNLVKQIQEPLPDHLGVHDQVPYQFVVTNGGTVPVTGLAVSDPVTGPVNCPVTTLEPDETTTCTATYTITAADVARGFVANTAKATGQASGGAVTSPESSARLDLTQQGPAVGIVKDGSVPSFAAAGQPVTYTFLVTNRGDSPLHDVTVNDTKLGDVCGTPFTLAVSETRTCTVHYVTTQEDVAAGRIFNAVAVSASPPSGPAVEGTDSKDIPLDEAPGISVTKDASVPAFAAAGLPVTYTFLVSNQGNVQLRDIKVQDTRLGDVCGAVFDLPPGGVRECTVHYVTTAADVGAGHIANAVTATGIPPSGPAVQDTASEDLPLEEVPGIAVTKDASVPAFAAAGLPVTYTFLVSNQGNAPLRDVTAHDTKLGDVCGAPFPLAVSGTRTCTVHYLTTAADVAAGHIANAVTVTGTPPTGPAVQDSASDEIALEERPAISLKKTADVASFTTARQAITYTYTVTDNGNVPLHHVTLTDNKAGRVRCPATTLAPGASMACTARYTTTAADMTNGKVVNIATAAGLTPGQSRVTAQSSLTIARLFLPVTG